MDFVGTSAVIQHYLIARADRPSSDQWVCFLVSIASPRQNSL